MSGYCQGPCQTATPCSGSRQPKSRARAASRKTCFNNERLKRNGSLGRTRTYNPWVNRCCRIFVPVVLYSTQSTQNQALAPIPRWKTLIWVLMDFDGEWVQKWDSAVLARKQSSRSMLVAARVGLFFQIPCHLIPFFLRAGIDSELPQEARGHHLNKQCSGGESLPPTLHASYSPGPASNFVQLMLKIIPCDSRARRIRSVIKLSSALVICWPSSHLAILFSSASKPFRSSSPGIVKRRFSCL
jgi:hypothetical protein